MSDYADALVGRRAVEAGLVTAEALAACVRELEADAEAGRPRRSLARVLADRGLVNEERLRSLLGGAGPIASRGDTATIADAGAGPATREARLQLSGERPPDDPTLTSVRGRGEPSAPAPAVGPAPAAEEKPAAGPAHFGRYRLESEIARGGMGVVYRAFDTQVRRTVALKVMLGGDAVPVEARRRFEREALLAARLNHPNVVPVHEVGEFEGKLYFTMELVEGESLQQVLHRMKAIPPRAALRIARDVARALEHAHERNLIHRDIKPGNVLITKAAPEGGEGATAADSTLTLSGSQVTSFRVMVADFGLAKDVTSDTLLTRDGNVLGTPMYMSPEQAGGDIERVGPRSDVYSLGAVLYEMLCGRKPFAQDSAVQLLAAVILEDPIPLRRHAPGLHPDLETIVAKAMEKDPDRRYASAKALANDIDRYLNGEIIQARPAGAVYRAWRKTVRHRAVVVPTLLAALAIATAMAWTPLRAAWQAREERRERERREEASAAALAGARAAAERGDAAEARRRAEALVEGFTPWAERGERHPLAEAHATLADLFRRAGDEPRALRERFRAYRAATRGGTARAFLLGMARELVEQSRFDEARGILLRVGGVTATDPIAAEAAYWRARVAESTLEFDAAHAGFRVAAAGPLPAELRGACAEHLEFCTLLAGEAALPAGSGALATGDLDGDGRPEVLAVAGTALVAGSLAADGTWKERARFDPGAETAPISGLATADLDGDGRAEVLAAGGSEKATGALLVLAWADGALVERARVPLRTQVSPQPFAAGDLDGDGDVELLLGTGPYERALHVWTWRRAEARLEERCALPIGGDVIRVHVADVADDPAPEVVVCAGAWSAYSVYMLRWNGGGLTAMRTVPLGWPTAAEPLGEGVFLIGNSWYRGNLHPMQHLIGRRRFEERYVPPGVWLCRLRSEAGRELEALEAGGWADGDDGAYGVCLLRGHDRRWLWTAGRMNGFADRPDPEADSRPAGSLWVEDGGGWRRFARVAMSLRGRFLSRGDLFLSGVLALDLDGDGDDEVVLAEGGGLRVRGLPGARVAEPPADVAGGDDPVGPGAAGLDALDAGRDAERVGLWEDALETYGRVLDASASAAELLAAGAGRLRCLAALGRHEDLVDAVSELVRAWPGREQDLIPPCVEALCAAGEWGLARRLVEMQLNAPGLDPVRRKEARERALELGALTRPAGGIVLIGAGAAPADWLLSSPFAVSADADGVILTTPTGLVSFGAVPVALDWSGAELRGDFTPERLEWAATLELGVTDAPPWGGGGAPATRFSLGFNAGGDTQYPHRTVWSSSSWARGGVNETLLFRANAPIGRLRTSVRCLPHPWRLVIGLEEEGRESVRRLHAAGPPGGGAAWVSWTSAASVDIGWWVRLRCRSLELASCRPGDGLRAFAPVSALDHLCLANGRWAFGRTAEAATLYDAAVRLADDEWADEERRTTAGLPSAWTGLAPSAPARWTAVDARLARGLLRWSRGDRADGMEDLRKALRLSAERVLRLIAAYAPVLAERANACEAISELWHESEGRPEGQALFEAAARAWRQVNGNDAAFAVLVGPRGVRAERFLEVTAVDPAGPLARSGLQAGDVLAEFDGRAVRTRLDWTEARIVAEERGAATVPAVFQRGSQRGQAEVPPTLEGLRVEEKIRLVR